MFSLPRLKVRDLQNIATVHDTNKQDSKDNVQEIQLYNSSVQDALLSQRGRAMLRVSQ